MALVDEAGSKWRRPYARPGYVWPYYILIVLLSVLVLVALLMTALGTVTVATSTPESGDSLAFGLALLVMSGLGLVVPVRAARSGVYVSKTGVLSRGFFASRKIPWDQVAGFAARDPKDLGVRSGRYIFIDLKDGGSVRTVVSSRVMPRSFDQAVLSLQEALQQRPPAAT